VSELWPDDPSDPGAVPRPYRSSADHLWAELCRVDLLVRAQVVHWKHRIARTKPERLWALLHVTEAEVETYLLSHYTPPPVLAHELNVQAASYCQKAARVAEVITRSRERTASDLTLRLVRLAELFDLSRLELDALLVCLLPELDGRYRRLFGVLQDDATRTRPSAELVMQTLSSEAPDPAVARQPFLAGSALFANHLLIATGSDEPLPVRSLRVDDRVVSFLLGGDAPDARLTGLLADAAQVVRWDDLTADPDQVRRLRTWADWWCERWGPTAGAVWLLHGPLENGQLPAARTLCTALDTPLLAVNTGRALRSPAGWELIVDLCYREARLRGAALYWRDCPALLHPEQPPELWANLIRVAERFAGLTFLESATAWEPSGRFRDRLFLRLDFPAPAYALRRRLWQKYLPPAGAFEPPSPDRDRLAEALANAFHLTEGGILDAVAAAQALALARDPNSQLLRTEDIYDGCRRQSNQRLMTFARRIVPRARLSFDDLILPQASKIQIQELRDRIRLRSQVISGLGFEERMTMGRGFVALFTGSSGTGKTMAAELLAHEQGVELFKVDLSAVVSKWVGVTEQNLSVVFAEAEASNAVILFDECEALFSKRGEVKEARDRWANLEANYLLQRIEEYSGVVILTSNFRQNIDEAFLRRIHAIVEFPFPDAEARARIMLGLFPAGLTPPPAEEIRDLARRAQLSGGSARNVVLDAAYRALAEAGTGPPKVAIKHLVLAAAREYQKLGKPITRADFGETYYRWIEKALQ
jgi:hypothetical protein